MRRIGKQIGGDRAFASAFGGIDALFQRRRAGASRTPALLPVDTPSPAPPQSVRTIDGVARLLIDLDRRIISLNL